MTSYTCNAFWQEASLAVMATSGADKHHQEYREIPNKVDNGTTGVAKLSCYVEDGIRTRYTKVIQVTPLPTASLLFRPV